MPRPKEVFAFFDFDETLVDFNSDLWVFDRLCPEIRGYIKKGLSEHVDWTELIDGALLQLYDAGFMVADIKQVFREAPMVARVPDLLRMLKRCGAKVVIVSDANTLFIECILEGNGIRDLVDEIISNPILRKAGRLKLIPYSTEKHECEMSCPPNLCKGTVIDAKYPTHKDPKNAAFYIGDGQNDACPSYRLTKNGSIFIRKGRALDRIMVGFPYCVPSVHLDPN